MIVDIDLKRNSLGYYDIYPNEDGDIATVDNMDTALLMSLLCRKRALKAEIAINTNRSGWVGNLFLSIFNFENGSKLWLSSQSIADTETLNFVVARARNSLQWMITDKICDSINVEGSLVYNTIYLLIALYKQEKIIYSTRFDVFLNSIIK